MVSRYIKKKYFHQKIQNVFSNAEKEKDNPQTFYSNQNEKLE